MGDIMKITVITVCFNSVDTIEKAIESVINQDYPDKEYIIVDGGSTDGTVNIIKKYENCISRWISEPDDGIFDAMNKGIHMATGNVIAFLNSDDWYVESALSMVCEVFEKNDCDCVCCDNYVIQQDGSQVYYDASNLSQEDMYKRMIYFHSAIFAKKELFEKSNNFDLTYRIAADYDWILRAIEKGARLFYLHKPIFTFCYGGVSSVNEIECAREAKEIAIRHLPIDKKDYLEDINDRYYGIVACASSKEWIVCNIKKALHNEVPIVLWGTGDRGKQCMTWLKKADIQIMAVIDGNKDKWGKFFQGMEIQTPQYLKGKACNLIITPDKYREEINEQIYCYQDEIFVYGLKELWRKMVLNDENNDCTITKY